MQQNQKALILDEKERNIEIDNYDIEFDHVSFSYGEHRVINDVSFKVGSQTCTAIIGPSGSGKSSPPSVICC